MFRDRTTDQILSVGIVVPSGEILVIATTIIKERILAEPCKHSDNRIVLNFSLSWMELAGRAGSCAVQYMQKSTTRSCDSPKQIFTNLSSKMSMKSSKILGFLGAKNTEPFWIKKKNFHSKGTTLLDHLFVINFQSIDLLLLLHCFLMSRCNYSIINR